MCYNYQYHDYPPLEAWDAIYTLGKSIQSENVPEADHYETVKTMVEVFKASGVNFPLLCTYIIDMAEKTLQTEG